MIIVVAVTAVVITFNTIIIFSHISQILRPSRGARSDETESSGSVQQFWVLEGWWTKGSTFAFRCQLSQLSTFKDGAGLANSFVPLGGHRHTSAAE